MRSSVDPSSSAADDLTNRTIALWRARRGHDLSREDARQIVENATGFFAILAEWSRAEATTQPNRKGERTHSAGLGEARGG